MKRFLRTILFGTMTLFGSCAGPSLAPATSINIDLSSSYDFCGRERAQCVASVETTLDLDFDVTIELAIARINDAVNTEIVYKTDKAHYGAADFYALPHDGFGDCEDFALEKRRRLIEAGVPAGAVRLIAGLTARGASHMVLGIWTTNGVLVLDLSRPSKIEPLKLSSVAAPEWVQDVTRPMAWKRPDGWIRP